MNKQAIIAGINNYVLSLSKDDQKAYKYALDCGLSYGYPVAELAGIVQALTQEIKESEQKKTMGSSYTRRSKLAAKLLLTNDQERFKKAFTMNIHGESMQCIMVNGVYAFMLKSMVDVPMFTEKEKPFVELERVIPKDYKQYNTYEYDLADMKTKLKLHKTQKDKFQRKKTCVFGHNGKYYNMEFFANIIELLGDGATWYKNENNKGIDVFENENGIAVLCPINPNSVNNGAYEIYE